LSVRNLLSPPVGMFDDGNFRHLGGGRKGVFLLLRYIFIVAASYLLIFEKPTQSFDPTHGVMIAAALASNIALSLIRQELIFAWYVEAPILIADTLWVSWALGSTGSGGQELFLLYFLVLFLAALGESLLMVLLGSTFISVANAYFSAPGSFWTSPQLLRVVFFYAVALFYGHVISQIKQQRLRADKGFAWARELETKVAERTAQLSRLYDQAREATRLKSEFVANMSHELRTPLNIIMGYTELLLDRDSAMREPEREQMLRRILESAQLQAKLVQSVLDLGKVEAGKMPVDNEPVVLDRLMMTLQRRERMPLAAGVGLSWELEPNLPLIETDSAKLAIVMDNLINNAIKFTAAGFIRVSVRNLAASGEVEFRVDDSGPGIAPQDLPTIFEAFRQIDGSITREHGGVGLGLAIVQKYVDLLGGRVQVESERGKGSSFTVVLPYRARGHAAREPETRRPELAVASAA
jgi:signal transduction histidine kinase